MYLLSEMTSFPDYARSVTTIVCSMFIGVVIAALLSLFYRYYYGSFIRFLLDSKALDEDSAIRLDKTAYGKRLLLRLAIKNGYIFRNVLRFTEPQEVVELPPKPSAKQRRNAKRADLLTRKYYIPEELTFRADNQFNKKGTNFMSALFGILIFLLVAGLCLVIIPDLITMFGNFINGL